MALGARVLNGGLYIGPEIRFVRPTQRPLIERLPPWRIVGLAMRLAVQLLPRPLLRPLIAAYLTAAMAPDRRLFEEGAILVNKNGARFTDEKANPGYAVAAQPDNVAYVVFDDAVARKFSAWPNFISTAPGIAYAYVKDYRRFRPDLYRSAPTLAGLAAAIGVPAAALEDSAAHFAAPPFHALGPAKAWLMTTHGGLDVNMRLEVLDRARMPIPGLYAAGSTGHGGLFLGGHGHSLGWAFTSGRIAGRNAAAAKSG
jgi:fumarate reductase flavoprotein subunit